MRCSKWCQDINGDQGDWSGYSISLSKIGTRLAIGAPWNNSNGSRSGRVKVFEENNGNWIQVGQNILGLTADDEFGTSVSISANGSKVAIGAWGRDENGSSYASVTNINQDCLFFVVLRYQFNVVKKIELLVYFATKKGYI